MSDHEHAEELIRYKITLTDRHWWGGQITLEIIGVGSSKKDDELLIHLKENGFYSINFNHVVFIHATGVA